VGITIWITDYTALMISAVPVAPPPPERRAGNPVFTPQPADRATGRLSPRVGSAGVAVERVRDGRGRGRVDRQPLPGRHREDRLRHARDRSVRNLRWWASWVGSLRRLPQVNPVTPFSIMSYGHHLRDKPADGMCVPCSYPPCPVAPPISNRPVPGRGRDVLAAAPGGGAGALRGAHGPAHDGRRPPLLRHRHALCAQ
jgi:hypothetical protein